ncbi:MAG: hypothetical protein II634_01305, partial [Lachnospiraceae bacterium]|nr:hypothetical protein [Lachnospiraceae bacterium]
QNLKQDFPQNLSGTVWKNSLVFGAELRLRIQVVPPGAAEPGTGRYKIQKQSEKRRCRAKSRSGNAKASRKRGRET